MRERVLRNKKVCEILDISETTLWRWRKAGYFPEPRGVPHSSIKGWAESTIDEWVMQNYVN